MSIIYKYDTSIPYVHKEQYDIINNIEVSCEICDTAKITNSCNKCGSGVCDDNICCLKFPHKYNTTFIVCATCVEQIEKKLIPLIDIGKLKLLKSKIKNNKTTRSPRSSSISSSSSESFVSSDELINDSKLESTI